MYWPCDNREARFLLNSTFLTEMLGKEQLNRDGFQYLAYLASLSSITLEDVRIRLHLIYGGKLSQDLEERWQYICVCGCVNVGRIFAAPTCNPCKLSLLCGSCLTGRKRIPPHTSHSQTRISAQTSSPVYFNLHQHNFKAEVYFLHHQNHQMLLKIMIVFKEVSLRKLCPSVIRQESECPAP